MKWRKWTIQWSSSELLTRSIWLEHYDRLDVGNEHQAQVSTIFHRKVDAQRYIKNVLGPKHSWLVYRIVEST